MPMRDDASLFAEGSDDRSQMERPLPFVPGDSSDPDPPPPPIHPDKQKLRQQLER